MKLCNFTVDLANICLASVLCIYNGFLAYRFLHNARMAKIKAKN